MLTNDNKRIVLSLSKMLFGENARRAYQILVGSKVLEVEKYSNASVALTKEMVDLVGQMLKDTSDLEEKAFASTIIVDHRLRDLKGMINTLVSDKEWDNQAFIFNTVTKDGIPVITGFYETDDMAFNQSYYNEVYTEKVFKKFNVKPTYIDGELLYKEKQPFAKDNKVICAPIHTLTLDTLSKILSYYDENIVIESIDECLKVAKSYLRTHYNLNDRLANAVFARLIGYALDADEFYRNSEGEYFADLSRILDEADNPIYDTFVRNLVKFLKETNLSGSITEESMKDMFPGEWFDWSFYDWKAKANDIFDGTLEDYNRRYKQITGKDSPLTQDSSISDAGIEFDSFK